MQQVRTNSTIFFLDDNQPSKMEKYLNVILDYVKNLKNVQDL